MRYIAYLLILIMGIFLGVVGSVLYSERQTSKLENENIPVLPKSNKVALKHRDQESGLNKKGSTTESISRQQPDTQVNLKKKIQTGDEKKYSVSILAQENDIQADDYDEDEAAAEGLQELWEDLERRREDIYSSSEMSIDLEDLESSMRDAGIPEEEIEENLEGLAAMKNAAHRSNRCLTTIRGMSG